MTAEIFAENQATTTVTSGGTNAPAGGTQETWTVASSAMFPAASSTTPATQFHIADAAGGFTSEIIAVTNVSGTTWTVIRGAEGTIPVAHSGGFTVDQVVTSGWLGSVQTSLTGIDWLNVLAYGADSTGSSDSTTAIQAAVSALTSAGGVIYFPTGTYKVSSTITISIAGVTLQGDGLWSSVINYTGSGDCIRMYSSLIYTSGIGGGIKGVTIDGTSASAGACGVHAGDIYQLQWDVGVRKFQGTGSKGIWFDNQYFWCEDMYGHVWGQQNTQNVVFDNSANVGGSATNSFARANLDIVLDCKGVGDGVTLLNGAEVYNSRLNIEGNMDYGSAQHYALSITGQTSYSFTATHASPCVFTAAGSYYANGTYVTLSGGSLPGGFSAQGYYVVSASGATFELSATSGGSAINSSSTGSGTVQGPFSQISASILQIGMECNSTSGTYQPITISFGTQGSNLIRNCTGIIDFTANNAFANAVNWNGSFQFDGICIGDSQLLRVVGASQSAFVVGVITNGAFITTRYNNLATAAPSSNVTGCILGTNDLGTGGASRADWANTTFTLVNIGTGSITFAASGTSHVETGTACVIPAGNSMTFAWLSGSGTWYPLYAAIADTTAADIQPDGIQAAGSNGLWADSGHVHQNNADLSLYLAPSGATGETFPRAQATTYFSSLTSEQVYVSAIPLPKNLQINDISMVVGGAAFTTVDVTHGWYALLDSSRVVRAVSADQTSGNWGTTFTTVTLPVTSGGTYTTTYGGLYYVALCITFTSTSGEFSGASATVGGVTGLAPILQGTSSTGQTTPPGLGGTLSAITNVAADRFYAWTT